MSVKQENPIKSQWSVIAGACLLTASVTWYMVKWTYQEKEMVSEPPVNMWKIALIAIGMIWVMIKTKDCFQWISRQIRILESIQNASISCNYRIPTNEFNNDSKIPKRMMRGNPRQRAMAAMGETQN